MKGPIHVTLAGHTNTGKTSLMRTLLRDVGFGNVSDRPAVTRGVQAAVLAARSEEIVELYDTPGLEDSIGLLERLETLAGDRRGPGVDAVEAFLAGRHAEGGFAQEAKVLRQVLASDLVLYVVDARDPVRGKHRDELTILGRCARPVVPVLNFTASPENRVNEWREHLSRVGMHAVAEFDTVVFSPRDERRLFEKMKTLLNDERGDALDRLLAERVRERAALVRTSSRAIAECLVDTAAYSELVPTDAGERSQTLIDRLKDAVRGRERGCVQELLDLHRFRVEDVEAGDLPLAGAVWGLDLFSPETLKRFGVRAGSAAATGAMVGLTADVLLGGLSLGTATAAGAAIGGLYGAARTHGRRVMDRIRGLTELRCDDATLRLLVLRQITLAEALLRRGHASVDALRLDVADDEPSDVKKRTVPKSLMGLLARARRTPKWSTMDRALPANAVSTPSGPASAADPARADTVDGIAHAVEQMINNTTP